MGVPEGASSWANTVVVEDVHDERTSRAKHTSCEARRDDDPLLMRNNADDLMMGATASLCVVIASLCAKMNSFGMSTLDTEWDSKVTAPIVLLLAAVIEK